MRAKGLVSVAVLGVVLAACGGSSDDGAGSPTAFSVSPTEKGITAGAGAVTCYQGYAGDFLITGGTAPYNLYVSNVNAIQLDTNQVSNRNGLFKVFFINGWCLDPGTITILDAQGNRITVTLTNKLAS
jgi:hypothetical protein